MLPQIKEGWQHLANIVDDPTGGSSNVPMETLKGALAGGMEGLGDVASNLTSPLGLASTGLAGALGAGARAGKAVSPQYLEAIRSKMPAGGPGKMPAEFAPTGGEQGMISTETLAKLGLGGLGAGVGIPKLVQLLRSLSQKMQDAKQRRDPYGRAADILNQSGGQ